MKNRFAINEYTYWIAQDAMRDILLMYWDLGNSYNGFGHNIETGRFNQYLFIDSFLEDEGYAGSIDLPLIHQGSAIKILCYLSDHLDEHGAAPEPGSWFHARLTELLSTGKLDPLASAKIAVYSGLNNEPDFNQRLEAVYQEYVIKWVTENWKLNKRVDETAKGGTSR